ncbi:MULTISPECIES: hypothetical protein [Streptomyces]|uniref:hypothetical protein n=1 Tax=Streptomyces TaxID=1883 RepID=UPI00167D8318|nr:hypothetical protein [Streptomyces sp. SID7805]
MSGAVCCRCERLTLAPVAVRYVERASGPSVTLYACPDCAPRLIPGPLPGEAAAPLRG